MGIEVKRDSYLSLLARTAAIFREQWENEGPASAHDRGVSIARARQLEELLRRTRSSESESFIMIDGYIENLMNAAGTICTR